MKQKKPETPERISGSRLQAVLYFLQNAEGLGKRPSFPNWNPLPTRIKARVSRLLSRCTPCSPKKTGTPKAALRTKVLDPCNPKIMGTPEAALRSKVLDPSGFLLLSTGQNLNLTTGCRKIDTLHIYFPFFTTALSFANGVSRETCFFFSKIP